MYVHLGRGCLIKTEEIIGIFSAKGNNNFYKLLKNKKGDYYDAEDLTEDGNIYSIILSQDKIYLTAISATTLQKRINSNIIYHNGGNNG